MNSLKTMATAAIMVAGLYGVYYLLNRSPDTSSLPEMPQDMKSVGAVDIPNVDISLPTAGNPTDLTKISPEQALASTRSPNYGQTPSPTNPAGVPVGVSAPTAAPLGDRFDPNNNTTTGASFDENQYTATGAANTGATWQDRINQVNQQLNEKRLADAHLSLSQAYSDPSATPADKKQIEPLLDQLAGTVVYSKKHLLERPYKVAPNDTLEGIAQRYNIPSGLLAKINGLDASAQLRSDQELKVVQGPFSATVDLSDYMLTLHTADGRYAGRFPIGVGPVASNINRSSAYMVVDKTDTSTYADQGQTKIGRRWIGLGEQLGLHGTDSPNTIGTSNGNEAISLGDRDIEDVYDILTIGSKVTIQP